MLLVVMLSVALCRSRVGTAVSTAEQAAGETAAASIAEQAAGETAASTADEEMQQAADGEMQR